MSEPDYIDWSHVSQEFKFMARDVDGSCYLYRYEPKISVAASWNAPHSWNDDGETGVRASIFASYRRGTTDWRKSLVVRPAPPVNEKE